MHSTKGLYIDKYFKHFSFLIDLSGGKLYFIKPQYNLLDTSGDVRYYRADVA